MKISDITITQTERPKTSDTLFAITFICEYGQRHLVRMVIPHIEMLDIPRRKFIPYLLQKLHDTIRNYLKVDLLIWDVKSKPEIT